MIFVWSAHVIICSVAPLCSGGRAAQSWERIFAQQTWGTTADAEAAMLQRVHSPPAFNARTPIFKRTVFDRHYFYVRFYPNPFDDNCCFSGMQPRKCNTVLLVYFVSVHARSRSPQQLKLNQIRAHALCRHSMSHFGQTVGSRLRKLRRAAPKLLMATKICRLTTAMALSAHLFILICD